MIFRILLIIATLAISSHSPIALSNDDFKQLDETACGFDGQGVEGEDFGRWTEKDLEWCERTCERKGSECKGYDYDEKKERCRVFYKKPIDSAHKDTVTCWLKDGFQGDSDDDDQGYDTGSDSSFDSSSFEKHRKTACGFGGEGVEDRDFGLWRDKDLEWCESKCEGKGSKCVGYDYDKKKDRCRVFYKQPYSLVDKDSVTCWLKDAGHNGSIVVDDDDRYQNNNVRLYEYKITNKSHRHVQIIVGGEDKYLLRGRTFTYESKNKIVPFYHDNKEGSIRSFKLSEGSYTIEQCCADCKCVYLREVDGKIGIFPDYERGMNLHKKPGIEDELWVTNTKDSVVWCHNAGPRYSDKLSDENADLRYHSHFMIKYPDGSIGKGGPLYFIQLVYNEKDAYNGGGTFYFHQFDDYKYVWKMQLDKSESPKFYSGINSQDLYKHMINEIEFGVALNKGSTGKSYPYGRNNPKNFVIRGFTLHQQYVLPNGKIDYSWPNEIWSHRFKCENIHPHIRQKEEPLAGDPFADN